MSDLKLTVTDSPHLSLGETVPRAMLDVILALVPVTLVAIYFFRLNAVFTLVVSLASAVLIDIIIQSIKGKKTTVPDGSVLVTAWILGLCLSPLTPWWITVFGVFLAVAVAKEWMGGLGWNRFNPAAFGLVGIIFLEPVTVFLNQAFSALAVRFPMAPTIYDTVTGATPLALLKMGELDVPYHQLLLANPGGSLAETSGLALLIGGAYLIYRQHICWRIPASMIGTVLVMALVLGHNPIYHVLAGGILLGAFFMATDWVTSPITDTGRIVFGVAIGFLVMLFRVVLVPTEVVALSIVLMNAFVPLIDRHTARQTFGARTSATEATQ